MADPGPFIPGTPETRTCTCGRTDRCNLTDCPLPAAVAYRRSVRPRWWEHIAGPVLYLTRRWWA